MVSDSGFGWSVRPDFAITPSNQMLVEKLNEVLKINSSRFKMPQITHKTFLELFELFIYETEHGIRVKKNGNKIRVV